ncbi:hypothetical protein UCRPC4_g01042 [Phaeomoniella chlamydospora]|uniref:Uncharacterized protein n=1 Tax=Phaeomoniella chlamydospora TaxID=158046 RepID=A0A0G2EXW8_PHACM|nr:hypothetical protein UCRPC4_g01042 [Phaeomoniella chlamydospora]
MADTPVTLESIQTCITEATTAVKRLQVQLDSVTSRAFSPAVTGRSAQLIKDNFDAIVSKLGASSDRIHSQVQVREKALLEEIQRNSEESEKSAKATAAFTDAHSRLQALLTEKDGRIDELERQLAAQAGRAIAPMPM